MVVDSKSLTATKKVFLSVDGLLTGSIKLSSQMIILTQAAQIYGCLKLSTVVIPETHIPTTLFDPISHECSTGEIYPVLFEIKNPV